MLTSRVSTCPASEEKHISDASAKPFRDLAVPYISTFETRAVLGYGGEQPPQAVPVGDGASNASVLAGASAQLTAVQYIVRYG